MEHAIIWLGLTVIFGIIEALTAGLTVLWFALGSAAALICTLCGGPLWLQIAVFIIVGLATLILVRPLARKYLDNRTVRTNADRIIGMSAKVTEAIDNVEGKGTVSVAGQAWSARSDADTPIPEGTIVKILRIEGVKAIVEAEAE